MEPNDNIKKQINIPQMLQKLDELYEKEEALKKQMIRMTAEYKQLQEDKLLMQTIIMHQSNKKWRITK